MDIAVEGLKEAIDALKAYRDSLDDKRKRLLERLAEIGVETANLRFSEVIPIYSGVFDGVDVGVMWVDDHTLAVKASGGQVGFLEFGAGIHHYGQGHPLAGEFGTGPGTYGPRGNQEYWYYKDRGGQIGEWSQPSVRNPNVIRTSGNPPSRAMYQAGVEIRKKITEIAKEIYES